MRGTVPFGCGQCLPCRINRRRQWMWRQYLESLCHDNNAFVTLTYSEDRLPANGSLEPRSLQLFIKRLRKAVLPLRIRYFAVGEYGEQTLRPHYHLSLFGLSGHQVVESFGRPKVVASLIEEIWSNGFTLLGDFNEQTAQYVSGYVVKKLGDRNDPRLIGLVPEFARMSNRPGIGAAAMTMIAQSIGASEYAMQLIEETGDVPRTLTIGKRKIPLGRYLLSKLRQEVGFTPEYIEKIKAAGAYDKSVEMLALFESALADAPASSPKQAFLASVVQQVRNSETRAKLFAQRKNL